MSKSKSNGSPGPSSGSGQSTPSEEGATSPGNNDEQELVDQAANLSINETLYEWLEDHPWQDYLVEEYLEEAFINEISPSDKYPVDDKWKDGNDIDLQKVYNDLPSFIKEMEVKKTQMKRKTERQEKSEDKAKYIAKSLPDPDGRKNYVIKWLDVDGYMLKVSVPENKKKFLKMSGFTSDNRPNLTRRWIFIPSYMRANCGLFDWTEAGIDEEMTIRIIVVRPSEFKEYSKHCGNYLPIISLPSNEIGIGYARYWIQKIATSLGLEYIWMIDDDVKQFYEIHPDHILKGKNCYAPRRRNFNEVFTKFESIVKDNKDGKLAAISPVAFRKPPKVVNECPTPKSGKKNTPKEKQKKEKSKKTSGIVRKPPRVAVFLNLKLINQQSVSYRPQLVAFEDMLFGKECEEKQLKVIMWKRIQVYSMNQWTKTGCGSPGGGGGERGGRGGEGEEGRGRRQGGEGRVEERGGR